MLLFDVLKFQRQTRKCVKRKKMKARTKHLAKYQWYGGTADRVTKDVVMSYYM